MTKDAILKELFENKEIYRIAKKYCNYDNLHGDLISELYITLQNKEDAFFKRLDKKQLFLYCCGILYFSWNSPTSPFYKKYRAFQYSELKGVDLANAEEDKDTFCVAYWIDKINKNSTITDNNSLVKVRVFEKYLELKSYRKVGAEFNIPFKTVAYIVKMFVNDIKE
jgi:hypothetical protein